MDGCVCILRGSTWNNGSRRGIHVPGRNRRAHPARVLWYGVWPPARGCADGSTWNVDRPGPASVPAIAGVCAPHGPSDVPRGTNRLPIRRSTPAMTAITPARPRSVSDPLSPAHIPLPGHTEQRLTRTSSGRPTLVQAGPAARPPSDRRPARPVQRRARPGRVRNPSTASDGSSGDEPEASRRSGATPRPLLPSPAEPSVSAVPCIRPIGPAWTSAFGPRPTLGISFGAGLGRVAHGGQPPHSPLDACDVTCLHTGSIASSRHSNGWPNLRTSTGNTRKDGPLRAETQSLHVIPASRGSSPRVPVWGGVERPHPPTLNRNKPGADFRSI
jgi:hypothetical protein